MRTIWRGVRWCWTWLVGDMSRLHRERVEDINARWDDEDPDPDFWERQN